MEAVSMLMRQGRAPEVDTDPECVHAMAALLAHEALQVDCRATKLVIRDRTSSESLGMYFGCCEGSQPVDFVRGLLSSGRKFYLPVSSYEHLKFNQHSTQLLFSLLAKVGKPVAPSADSTCQLCSDHGGPSTPRCENCNHCTIGSDRCHCRFPVLNNVIFQGYIDTKFAVGMENACGHFKGEMSIHVSGSLSRKSAHGLAPHLQHLSVLDICRADIPSSSIEELAPHIAVSHTLEKLKLCRCNINSDGAKLIASALAMNKSLVELHLDGNPIGDIGISHIARAMVERASVGLPPLDTLLVRNCLFSESGGLALSEAILKGGRPKHLNFLDNAMGEYALQEIAKSQQIPVLQLSAEEPVRIICLGSDGTGKSNLVLQFVKNLFIPDYDPTIEDSWRHVHTVDTIPVGLEILDTAGHTGFYSLLESYIRSGEVFALCYSIADHYSFECTWTFIQHINRIKEGYPVVLIGCKCDLEAERKVPREEGLAQARSWNYPLIETSAKTRTNITEAFDVLTRLALQRRHTQLCGTMPMHPRNGAVKMSMLSSISQVVATYGYSKKPLSVKRLVQLHLPCHHASNSSSNDDLQDWTLMASPP
ncbi:ras family small GTPase [Pelomyxa schiedti]|nr:ras family small GTPase [Pelomyxa schiedti]